MMKSKKNFFLKDIKAEKLPVLAPLTNREIMCEQALLKNTGNVVSANFHNEKL